MYSFNYVLETIRISPSAFLLAKNCTQPIELFDFDDRKLLVEPGTSIQLPVFAIHHDERFYDEPNSFKPERFESMASSELNKSGIFLPFGNGPRICLGKLSTMTPIGFSFEAIFFSFFASKKTHTTSILTFSFIFRTKICTLSNKIGFIGNCSSLLDYGKF